MPGKPTPATRSSPISADPSGLDLLATPGVQRAPASPVGLCSRIEYAVFPAIRRRL